MRSLVVFPLLLLLVFSSPSFGLRAEVIASGLAAPVFVTAPEGDPRLFVVELGGRILIIDEGVVLAAPFLDVSERVSTAGAGGLMSLAFDPGFASNGLFYVYYTSSSVEEIVLSRFQVGDDPDAADASGEEVLYTIPNPNFGHNGGLIAFSPVDGFLYVMPGEGGYGIYDPDELAQNPLERQGKVLRFDASGGVGAPLAPAPGNPFLGNPAGLDEIWALGLRNPWRWSFDRSNGDLWIADVGQEDLEEVDFQPAGHPGGLNYGWDVMEGSACNPIDPSSAFDCAAPGPEVVLPVHEYAHTAGDCSITGGYRYRGSIPEIQGLYFFGDFCSGRVATLSPPGWTLTDRTGEIGASANDLVSFGEDGFGELYQVLISGEIRRIRAASCSDGIDNDGDGAIDAEDFGCETNEDPSERSADLPCDDGIDNDGDELVDYVPDHDGDGLADPPGDPGCFSPLWNKEDPECQDGLDNDNRPGLDFDGGVSIWGVALDVPDPDCRGLAWSDHEQVGCGLGAELAFLLPLLLQARRRLRRTGVWSRGVDSNR